MGDRFSSRREHYSFPDFAEEQFESYRALGFHAAYGLFSGSDIYAYLDFNEDRVALPNVAVLNGLFAGAAVLSPAGVDTAFELQEELG